MLDRSKYEFKKFDNKVWLSSPTMHGEELLYMEKAYKTNWMSTLGENIDEIEKEISKKDLFLSEPHKMSAAQPTEAC